MKEKLLITGASGFIGFHLIEAALSAGLEVHAAVRDSSNVKHLPPNITLTTINYADEANLRGQLASEGYHFIIHAAGITKAKTAAAYNKINAGYTKALAKASVEIPTLKKWVFLSSLASIGPLKTIEGKISENTMPSPVTAYGFSKKQAEEDLKAVAGLPWMILRPTAVYGPREKDLFILFKTLNKGWDFYIGRNAQHLSFIYAKDLAAVTIKALLSQQVHKAYNLSDGEVYSKYDLSNYANQWMKRHAKKVHLPYSLAKTMAWIMEQGGKITGKSPALNIEKLNELTATNWICDISNAVNELDWQPTYSLEKGVKETLEWYKQHNWL